MKRKKLQILCCGVLCRRASSIYSSVLHPLNSIAVGGGEGHSPKNPTPGVSYLYLPHFEVHNLQANFFALEGLHPLKNGSVGLVALRASDCGTLGCGDWWSSAVLYWWPVKEISSFSLAIFGDLTKICSLA